MGLPGGGAGDVRGLPCGILGRADGAPLARVAYVAPMLWIMGISIVLTTAGRVVVETAKPSGDAGSDVRDKDINRFGGYVGGMVLAVAMAVPFGLAMAKAEAVLDRQRHVRRLRGMGAGQHDGQAGGLPPGL